MSPDPTMKKSKYIGIIHVFSCINICQVARKLFKPLPRDPANVNAMEQTCDRYSCILPGFQSKIAPKTTESILYDESSHCTKWRRLAKSNIKDIISDNNVNKSIDKMLIPGHNVLPRNVM